MVMDWTLYWKMCSDTAGPAFDRFRMKLLEGSQIATPQSAPAYLGALSAVLVTVCAQMARDLEVCMVTDPEDTNPEDGKAEQVLPPDQSRLRRIVRERYFSRLADIPDMEIAREYYRTHVQLREPDRQAMTRWLLSFRGRREEAEALAEAAHTQTSAFAREEIPRILEEARGPSAVH